MEGLDARGRGVRFHVACFYVWEVERSRPVRGMAPLRWTSKSVRHLAASLQRMGHQVSRQLVAELLAAAGYSLQANRKTREGTSHPDRDAQFRYINQQVRRFQAATQPVISVDTKKKELVGDFANAGREWRPRGEPGGARFLIPDRGRRSRTGVRSRERGVGRRHRHAPSRCAIGWWVGWVDSTAPGLLITRTPAAATAPGALWNGSCNGWPTTGWSRFATSPGDEQVEQDRTPAVLLHQRTGAAG